jgi:hypothetical protein
MSPKNPVQEGSVLPESRPTVAERNGGIGLFGATGGKKPPVRPVAASEFDGSVRNELLRLLKIPLSELDVDPDPQSTSVGQMFALILMRKAVKDQTLNAITEILDRIEGKSTKAAQNKPTNSHIMDQLNSSLDGLDDLTKEEE